MGGATHADSQYCNFDNQYAYTHFLQNGDAAGYIWHDELCHPLLAIGTPGNRSWGPRTVREF
jgi:hypothetical protein